jgi:hypothetical protein
VNSDHLPDVTVTAASSIQAKVQVPACRVAVYLPAAGTRPRWPGDWNLNLKLADSQSRKPSAAALSGQLASAVLGGISEEMQSMEIEWSSLLHSMEYPN